ncbi:MAG: hypothetical protein NTV82_06975 [Candidatus Aminicenantes bacterium]|nr:hypothetical protein [Candidatus Aminicenantes bacterium]
MKLSIKMRGRVCCLGILLVFFSRGRLVGQATERLEDFKAVTRYAGGIRPILTFGQFNGYTKYWHSIYWTWHQYANLYQISVPDVMKSFLQSKVDIAEELGVPGLCLDEGFLDGLLSAPYQELDAPTLAGIEKALSESKLNLLIHTTLSSGAGMWIGKAVRRAPTAWKMLKSHQANAEDFREVRASVLENGTRRLFVVFADDPDSAARMKKLIRDVVDVISHFDMHRGWFATGTLLHSVTCFPGHPLEVIAKGMSQGNDWFTFNGYMDFLLQGQLPEWLSRVGLEIVADVGTGKATHSFGTLGFGCSNWDGLKIQDTPSEEEWIKFVKERGGYMFRPVFAPECNPYKYDGYIAMEGNKKQIDNEDVPFILPTGFIREDAPPCMVLFTDKGTPFNREAMYKAILERREVGVLPQGKMLGPGRFRNVLQMLLLDRFFLENTFGDQIQIQTEFNGYVLSVSVTNLRGTPVSGTIVVKAAPELGIQGDLRVPVTMAQANQGRTYRIQPTLAAMGKTNPILVQFEWEGRTKRTLAVLDLPRAISAHQLLYGQSPEVVYPVSLHNFSDEYSIPVTIKVFRKGEPNRRAYETKRNCLIPPGGFRETIFHLPLSPGSYQVCVQALGTENWSQLGVEAAAGAPRAYAIDLNKDGLNEYRLENDKVQVTLLAIGARVIEYIVKEKNDNIFFKLWPEKEWATDKRPFRDRGFYPYGGFEDFLGQASMETHKVYEAELVKKSGSYVQVKMSADYYGNKLEKIFTLYGDSPLVEVRFALNFRNPEANMLGPQPILELGRRHWTEDVFIVPGLNGLEEYRMRPEEYFGKVILLKEGWNAGYDTAEDIAFVGAFPVGEPEFLHMWMNHPSNGESNHYYAEFQPWVPIYQKTIRYFSYYLWGAAGPWEKGLEELKRRNPVTSK